MLTLDPSKEPEALLGDIHAFIKQTQTRISARGEVDLAGLDTAIAALCQKVLTLGETEAKRYGVKLGELMAAVETMQANMITMQGEIAAAMKSLNQQKKAAHAYVKAPGVDS